MQELSALRAGGFKGLSGVQELTEISSARIEGHD